MRMLTLPKQVSSTVSSVTSRIFIEYIARDLQSGDVYQLDRSLAMGANAVLMSTSKMLLSTAKSLVVGMTREEILTMADAAAEGA